MIGCSDIGTDAAEIFMNTAVYKNYAISLAGDLLILSICTDTPGSDGASKKKRNLVEHLRLLVYLPTKFATTRDLALTEIEISKLQGIYLDERASLIPIHSLL